MTMAYIAIGYLDSWDSERYSLRTCVLDDCILKRSGRRVVGANPGEDGVCVGNRTYLAVRTINNEVTNKQKIYHRLLELC